jgi:hypothetical protein
MTTTDDDEDGSEVKGTRGLVVVGKDVSDDVEVKRLAVVVGPAPDRNSAVAVTSSISVRVVV